MRYPASSLQYFLSMSTLAWMKFLTRYRRTALGPLWLIVGPSLFIVVLGQLYAHIGATDTAVFIPHLTVGLVVWTLISGFIINSATVQQRNRAQILQGGLSFHEIVTVDIMMTMFIFLHQILIVAVVFIYYRVPLGPESLVSLIGIGLLTVNGIWVSQVFGIVGARYRDLMEVFQAVMRIAFLATPIIWIHGEGMRSGMLSVFLVFNPFYHFLEIVRAPLLGQPIAPLSWAVALSITVLGFIIARFVVNRYSRFVPLWV